MSRKGINRADVLENMLFEKKIQMPGSGFHKSDPCLFISYQQKDRASCITLADYIKNAGVDIFFDVYDQTLSEPEINNNPKQLVALLNQALNRCTHLLCVVSEHTKRSWWVPFEIGIAWDNKIGSDGINLLCLKDVNDIPEYLKLVNEVVNSKKGLDQFLKRITKTEKLLNETVHSFNSLMNEPIYKILKQ
jgi:hypothetical protein